MNRRYARKIRRGIRTAQQVMRRERKEPKMTPFGFRAAPPMPLWEIAYHHTISQAVHRGDLRPPRGPSPTWNSGVVA